MADKVLLRFIVVLKHIDRDTHLHRHTRDRDWGRYGGGSPHPPFLSLKCIGAYFTIRILSLTDPLDGFLLSPFFNPHCLCHTWGSCAMKIKVHFSHFQNLQTLWHLAFQNGVWLFSVFHVIPLARVPSCLWAVMCKVCRNNAPSVVSREWFTTMSSLVITQRQEPVLPRKAGSPRIRCALLCIPDATMSPGGSAGCSDPHPTKFFTSGHRWALSCSTSRRVTAAWGCVRAVAPLTIMARLVPAHECLHPHTPEFYKRKCQVWISQRKSAKCI